MQREQTLPILKVSKDFYIDLRENTGELLPFHHKENRAQSPYNVAQSLRKLRDLLNTNVTNPRNCLWVTLTYRENMRDTARLYDDFRKFNQRLQYHLAKNGLPSYEYIVAMEPQGRGAWHAHCVLLFDKKAPFLASDTLESIWGNGFVRVKSLTNVDNIGLYLSAYLGDLEVAEACSKGLANGRKIKEVDSTDKDGKPLKKAIVKGARLALYPSGFKLFRHSRGISYPTVKECTEQEALEEIGAAKLTYEKTIQLSESGRIINIISYRHYNRSPKGGGRDAEKQEA